MTPNIGKIIDTGPQLDARARHSSRRFGERGVVTPSHLDNLDRITQQRVTLMALPLKTVGAEASPVRAIVIED